MVPKKQLFAELLKNAATAICEQLQSSQSIPALLEDAWDKAQKQWPQFKVSAEYYAGYLLSKIKIDETDIETFLTEVDHTELYLACGCIAQDSAALEAFWIHYMNIAAPLRRMGIGSAAVDDIRQRVGERLLVSGDSELPQIGRYSGQGDLQALVYVSAYRMALNLLKKKEHERPIEDQLDIPIAGFDPELAAIQKQFVPQFKEAFQDAIRMLTPRDRTILRLRFVDGVAVEKIALIYRVHRVSASRWFSTIHENLRAKTLELLGERLAVPSDELTSMVMLVDGEMSMSLPRILASDS